MKFVFQKSGSSLDDSSTVNNINFLKQAFNVSKDTDDPKAKINPNSAVGCLIVKNNTIISKSANTLHQTIKNSKKISENLNNNRYHFIEHAKRAAIFKALNMKHSINGSSLYCTRFPCSDCTRAIIANGIIEIFLPTTALIETNNSQWHESQLAAELMLEAANIPIKYIDL